MAVEEEGATRGGFEPLNGRVGPCGQAHRASPRGPLEVGFEPLRVLRGFYCLHLPTATESGPDADLILSVLVGGLMSPRAAGIALCLPEGYVDVPLESFRRSCARPRRSRCPRSISASQSPRLDSRSRGSP
jgi:hypothetical protein